MTVIEAGVTDIAKSFAVIVTLAIPLMAPLEAVTVKGPPVVVPAVNKPVELMVPPPLTVQVKVGCGTSGLPF